VRPDEALAPSDFIRQIIRRDLETGKHARVVTRFPPNPNGYLHIGHAKSIVLNFGVAAEFGGACHLRFDDTNPVAEEAEFVQAIEEDVDWLGYRWDRTRFASDYFERMFELALRLIRRGKAYVCDLSSDELATQRGTLTEPGRPSPWRDRSPAENLDLFERMRAGEFENGQRTLRARIDMASPNLVLRDPVLYRVHRRPHHRTGDAFCIYPMYDFAQSPTDAYDGVTHSLCTLEFADHRPLYDWILAEGEVECRPAQIEFGPLGLTYTLLGKRFLRRLVEEGHVSGWDDPRLPTLRGMRRRGVPPAAIRSFCRDAGNTRHPQVLQIEQFEAAVRDELNRTAPRRMGVLQPLKLVIESYPEGREEELEALNNPEDPAAGTRRLSFARELWIERDDFLEDPPRSFFRLAPGREVRLRYAYLVTCTSVVKDDDGQVIELRCTHDPASRGGDAPDGRKVKGTLHWVSARHALRAEVRLYDRLWAVEDPSRAPEGGDILANRNPDSLQVVRGARLEPGLSGAEPGERFQLERLGYFCVDPDSRPGRPVLNRTVTLRDTWAKIARRERSA
jgi:glutaminyl-tRNA synthetase